MKRFYIINLLLILILAGCSGTSRIAENSDKPLIDESNIKLNLEFLASDQLEGREATTRGADLAALYISTQLKRNGVKPFFGDTSYFEPFKVDASIYDKNSKLVFKNDSTSETINFLDDFFIDTRNSSGKVEGELPVVFVGYGITAPEYGYDDYANLDVKGKFVIALDGEPASDDTTYFDGPKPSKYANGRAKPVIALEHGAAGYLGTINSRYELRWDFIKRFFSRPSFQLVYKEKNTGGNFNSFYIRSTALKSLLKNQLYSYDDLVTKVENNEPLPHFTLKGTLKSEITKKPDIQTAKNIVGVIEGNDPVLKNEYVAIGAHYDHLGVMNGKVYNGADDDGSGTVTVMEVAKAFAKSHANKRSILIVFHTGEEKGLLGSSYITDHLNLIKVKKVVGQINIDMVGRESPDSIYSIGSDKLSSEMKKIVEEVNSNTVRMALNYKFDDPNDPNRFYYRSDHYNYAKHGIPIVFFFDDMTKDYHKDTDEVDKINFEKLRKIATLVYGIADKIANLDHRLIVDKPIE